jgi:hypothetical protein
MNMMMPISHRLFASALAEDAAAQKPGSDARKPVTINVGSKAMVPVVDNGLTHPAPHAVTENNRANREFRPESGKKYTML